MKARKRPHPFLSRARAFWRVAAKKRKEGDYRSADWYAYQAQMAHTQWFKLHHKNEEESQHEQDHQRCR
jgi:hypothetical protein